MLFTGHSKIVALLLDNGADYSSSDSNGATPLHYASQNNYDVSMTQFIDFEFPKIISLKD